MLLLLTQSCPPGAAQGGGSQRQAEAWGCDVECQAVRDPHFLSIWYFGYIVLSYLRPVAMKKRHFCGCVCVFLNRSKILQEKP